jgi:hypothetical protein
MNIIRRTLDIDADTDARLREMAIERGQDIAAVQTRYDLDVADRTVRRRIEQEVTPRAA